MKLLIHFGIWVLLGYVSSEGTTTPFPPGSSKCQDEVSRPDEHCDDRTIRKSFICRYCGGDFEKRSVLTTHVRKIHPNEQPYWCKICSKGFSGTTNWKSHERTHTGEKPYSCELCSKKFNAKSNLRSHMRSHRNGERFFPCATCGTRFKTKLLLAMHVIRHETPFSCDLCNRRFREESELSTHLGTHANVEEHSCELCSQKFVDRYSLIHHTKTHWRDRIFSCKLCGKNYNYEKYFVKHMNTHKETDDAKDLPSHSKHYESDKRTSSHEQGAHASQEPEQGSEYPSYTELSGYEAGTSSGSNGAYSCNQNRRLEQESHCTLEVLESHDGAMPSDVCIVDGVPDESFRMAWDPICGTSSRDRERDMIRGDNSLVEEFAGIHHGPQPSIVSNDSEIPSRSARIAMESNGFSCNEGMEISREVERVINEIIRLHRETQRSNCESEGVHQSPK